MVLQVIFRSFRIVVCGGSKGTHVRMYWGADIVSGERGALLWFRDFGTSRVKYGLLSKNLSFD